MDPKIKWLRSVATALIGVCRRYVSSLDIVVIVRTRDHECVEVASTVPDHDSAGIVALASARLNRTCCDVVDVGDARRRDFIVLGCL